MRILFLSAWFLVGCAANRAPNSPSPTTAVIKAHAQREKAAYGVADQALVRQGNSISAAKTKAQNIDDKATIIIQHWDD